MITSVLRGGLGNQMFQYAIGRSLALKYKTDFALDTTFMNDRFPRREFTYRTYDLDVFDISPRFTSLSAISNRFPVPGAWLGLDLALIEARNQLGIRKLIKEKKDFYFDPSFSQSGENATLWGRWQSPKYFEDHTDIIRNDFTFRYPLTNQADELAKKMMQENSIAVHVRRGDYVAFQSVQNLMGEVDSSYYSDAARFIAERVDQPIFYIFAHDDPSWAREHVQFPHPTFYVGDDALGQKFSSYLQLMSLCKHNIIANSTFSWWGAWLNPNPKKIVIAPAVWQKNVITREADILPAGWTVLQ